MTRPKRLSAGVELPGLDGRAGGGSAQVFATPPGLPPHEEQHGGTEHTGTHGGNRLIFSVCQAMPGVRARAAPNRTIAGLRASVVIFSQ